MTALVKRLEAIHRQLLAIHSGSAELSNPVMGREREEFIDIFLRNCIPQGYRFGTGQAVDFEGRESHQLDIVVDSTFAPSIPLLGSSAIRLYPLESICSVIEVKSNYSSKWEEVVANSKSVKELKLSEFGGGSYSDYRIKCEYLAYFAVGYKV